jgi:hypothetical protein
MPCMHTLINMAIDTQNDNVEVIFGPPEIEPRDVANMPIPAKMPTTTARL